MNKLQEVVASVLEQQKQRLAPSTYDSRRNYLKHLLEHAESMEIDSPCQELYDSFVALSTSRDTRFQHSHAVRLVDKEAETKAFTLEGKLYNEPEIPSDIESGDMFKDIIFPIQDDCIDVGYLIRLSESEMEYLHLSPSTCWQYMQAWRELYIFLYLKGDTLFDRGNCNAFIEKTTLDHQNGTIHEWKRKIRRRAVLVLLEVAETGRFEWKLFTSRKPHCAEGSLEKIRQQYILSLHTQDLEDRTIALYDYSLRILIEGLKIDAAEDLASLRPEQIQNMMLSISERLALNSKRTIFPIVRQIFSYLYGSGFTKTDFSGMIMTPAYQKGHLKPYMTASDEEKLFQVMENSSLRTKAMMRLAIRLGLRDIDICNLRFDQIDWARDRIVLEQEKTSASLSLPLLEDVGNAIMDYILNERPKDAKSCPYVFVRKQAPYKKLTTMYPICSKLFGQADIKTINRNSRGVHVCRYTLAHKLLLQKVPHQVITDTLGHKSKESDKPYISMEEQMLRECPLDFSVIGQKYWKDGGCHV